MLHLVQSNKMELLLAELLRQLAHQSIAQQDEKTINLLSLLRPDTVLVQSPGMAQWLKINIADTLQIAANLEFPLPSTYIWQLYKQVIPTLPDESAFNKTHLTWKILQLLPTLRDEPLFQQVNQYLEQEQVQGERQATNTGNPSLKSYHLAAKIADIYDQYLMYRPDWIACWENGDDHIDDVDVALQPWQPPLWRMIVAYSAELKESSWHRANMHDALVDALTAGQFHGPKTLHVFGMSTIPLQQLDILRALAETSDVYIYWFNPTQHFWADVVDTRRYQKQQLSLFEAPGMHQEHLQFLDVGNPLLASWGKIGRDFHQHLSDIELQQHDLFEAPSSDGLLGWLQNEIFQLCFRQSRVPLTSEALFNNDGEFPKKRISQSDRSFEIHITHSVLRELEILRDQICHWFMQNQVSSLSDIIVMMPDVASYAPLIDAVFSRPLPYFDPHLDRNGEPAWSDGIPYAISDRSKLQEDAIVESFIRLMSLHLSRLSLTDIFELITVPEIAARYELDETSLNSLRQWCADAGIRWGLNAQDKSRFELPDEEQNTWSFGIKRLMAGLASNNDDVQDDASILPFDEVEGQLTNELGKLLAFVEDVEALTQFCCGCHSLDGKVNEALTVIDCFFEADSQQEYRLQQLKESVAKLKVHARQFTGNINQDVFVAVIKEQLNQSGVGQRFLAGKLNFCTLMPMRSIPFKHVCLLGMNEADYPRQTTPVSFDLMNAATPRRGDRSRRQDDRYLFLEALLSARKKFHISYIGKSDRSNAPLEPSILVNEVVQYCVQSVCFEHHSGEDYQVAEQAVREYLTTEHPLRPWDSAYFHAAAPTSFDAQFLSILQAENRLKQASAFLSESDANPLLEQHQIQEGGVEIALEGMVQFFRNPVKSWFKQYWKTQFPALQAGVNDEEPLTMNALDNHLITAALLTDDGSDRLLQHFKLAGQLPLANLRAPKEAELLNRVEQVRMRIMACLELATTEKPEFHPQWCVKTLSVDGVQVQFSGLLPLTPNGDLLLYRPGKLRAIDRFSLWCYWCLYCAQQNVSSRGWFIAENKSVMHEAMSAEEATAHLQQLLRTMLLGEHYCLPFFPETAMVWMESHDAIKTINTYQGNNFVSGEGQETHNTRVYPDLDGVWATFIALAEELYQPVLAGETIT